MFEEYQSLTKSMSKWGSYDIQAVITDKQKFIIFPDPESIFFIIRMYVKVVIKLRIWFGKDLQDTSKHDNIGEHCADVYEKISNPIDV